MKKKKTFNPFKMAGSWIGAFISLLLQIIQKIKTTTTVCDMNGICTTHFDGILDLFRIITRGCGESYCEFYPPIYGTISLIIVGFLIGWGIHALIRKLTKGKV